MPITAPTPPTPPTPPPKLESKTQWAVEIHPPVPHFSFGKRKSASVEEVSEEIADESSEEIYDESEEAIEESSVEEIEKPFESDADPLQIARDRVQTYHRAEDGKSETTSTQSNESRAPLQTNNRLPGEVRPEELTRDAADARGKVIVEQFRKLEEMRDQQKSQSQNQTQQSSNIPHINPSEHKSSLGTLIFTFTAVLVLVIVAFFTLRKSRLQKRREEMNSKTEQKKESIEKKSPEPIPDLTSEPIPIAKSIQIPTAKIKSAYQTSTDSIEKKSPPKHKTQLNTELINAKLKEKSESAQAKSNPIPTAKIKSVDRNPTDGKTHFEVRI